jgi:3-hydroxypropanoate dehydrogenase
MSEPADTAEPAAAERGRAEAGCLDLLFRAAHTPQSWTGQPVTDAELREVYALLRLAPTSANCSPARFLFLRSQYAKQRLLPALSPGNVDRTMTAPIVTIVGHDPRFYDQLPRLYPQADARAWFAANAALAEETAFRNGTLQGAYLILAARAVGLECAPMSGFNRGLVERDILADYGWKANFLVCLGHGDPATAPARGPRLEFEQACVLL